MTEKVAILMDSQILNALETCPTYLEFRFNQKLVPIFKEKHFEKGDLMHKALAFWRRLMVHRRHWDFFKRVELSLKLMDKLIVKMHAPIEELNEEKKYFEYYVTTKYRRDDEFRTISVEKPFIKSVYDCPQFKLYYTGQIDWLYWEDTPTPLDTKTGSRASEPSRLSNQFIGYAYCVGSNKVVVDKINFYTKMDPQKSFIRYPIVIDKELKSRWLRKLVKRAHEYFNFMRNGIDEYVDTNYTSCDKYSGCIFRKICDAVTDENQSLSDLRKYIKMSQFKIAETWDISKGVI